MEGNDKKKSGEEMKFNPNDPKHWKDFDPFAKATEYVDGKSEGRIIRARASRIKAENIEWKENQLKGTRTKRANSSWKENVKKGVLKREQQNTFNRKALNQKLAKDEKWLDAVKKGIKDRWKNPENLTKCSHCSKLCDNANYKRWHGDNCKLRRP